MFERYDTIMVVAFAPLVALLLGISAITVPWGTLLTSVVLYILIPVIIAQVWRKSLLQGGTVGVLIEVPVMLLVVSVVNRSKGWNENPGRSIKVES